MIENHGAAVLDQFAELTIIIVRALIKAVKGLNIKEILQTVRANTNEERFSNALHNLLMSFMADREKKQALEEEIVTFPQYRRFSAEGRDYEIIPAAKRHENYIPGKDLMQRAKNHGANLGEEEIKHILSHQIDLPPVLRKFNLVFTDWRSEDGQLVAYLAWNGKEWECRWRPIDQDWQQAHSWWLIKHLR